MMDSRCEEIIVDSDDVFDRLPDEILLSILDKLQDAKSLCSSMSVCKRFQSIAPQVDEIFLRIPQKKAAVRESDQETHKSFLKNLVIRTMMKPFNLISQMIKFKSKNNEENDLDFYSYYLPNRVLKSFEEIRTLHLRLPGPGIQKQGTKNIKDSSTLLKWKAVFGRELHSCVILAAKSWTDKPEKDELNLPESDQESRVMTDDELKMRIVWTISCLIAASARHYLIRETVKALKTIENVVISDESDQGRLCMNKEQIEEMRESKGKGDQMLEYRSRVPALRMKMWYLEKLDLPDSGKVMEGATLVVIRPAATGGGVEDVITNNADTAAGAFAEEGDAKVLCEAVRKLMVAKKCYTLEMSSF